MKKTNILIGLILVMPNLASAEIDYFNNLSFGFQLGENNGLEQYLGPSYVEKGRQGLAGGYASLSTTFNSNIFFEAEFTGMSTGKTQYRDHYAGLGIYGYANGALPFLSFGINRIDVERGSGKFNEYSPSAHIGVKFIPISFLTLTPSYRYSHVDKDPMNKFSLTSEINFTDHFALELGASYKTYRESEQWSGISGLKFYF
ncbi:hypothetical protein P4S52_02540 [Vibrio sp. SA48]|uniref:hypothetical protein n=1 Tax=Vibrio sp. S12_S33 TaxID=2720223 RepID=UPI00177DC971|nr:hypothetical protein [Vibrio sp. S12_S33]MBD1565752.1 hypothetical protein [Vibrio sp. S12_S33]